MTLTIRPGGPDDVPTVLGLLDRARDIARAQGVSLLRVDCYAGDDRALVSYYKSQGFTPTDTFNVDVRGGVWPGQVLAQRL